LPPSTTFQNTYRIKYASDFQISIFWDSSVDQSNIRQSRFCVMHSDGPYRCTTILIIDDELK